jgi:hypothetical protein
MAKLEIIVSEKGVESLITRVNSVGDGVAAGQLSAKTALALRLMHESAKSTAEVQATPVPYFDSLEGSFTFRCVCGRVFSGPWEESRWESVAHVETHHASTTIKRDLDALEDTIEALIVPSPLHPISEVFKDQSRTFGAELVRELATLFTDLKIGNEKAAIDLVDYCGWNQVTGLNYDEVKVSIIDGVVAKKIQPQMHEVFLTAMALFLRQVGRLSKKYRSKK